MKTEQQQQARNLYFETELTQAQIAQIVGISEKTMSLWVNEERWNRLKTALVTTPAMMIEKLYLELAEINFAIASRAPGKRYANTTESEIRRKILASIHYIKEQQSAGTNMEVLMNFIEFLKDYDPELLIPVTRAADYYLKYEKDLAGKNIITPYNIQLSAIPPAEDDSVDIQSVTQTKNKVELKKNKYRNMSRKERIAMEQFDEFTKKLLSRPGTKKPDGQDDPGQEQGDHSQDQANLGQLNPNQNQANLGQVNPNQNQANRG